MKTLITLFFCLSTFFLCSFSRAQENTLSDKNSYILKADNGKKIKDYKAGRAYRIKYYENAREQKARGLLEIKDADHIVLQPVANRDVTTTIPVESIASISPLLRNGRKTITYVGGGIGVVLSAIGLVSASNSLQSGEDLESTTSGFFGGTILAAMGVTVLAITGIADLTTLLIEGLSTKSNKKRYHFFIEKE